MSETTTVAAEPSAAPEAPRLAPPPIDVDSLPIWESTKPPAAEFAAPAAAPPVVDPPVVEAKPAEPVPAALTQAHAELAKREALVLEAKRQLKAQEAALAKATRLEQLAKTDPAAVLAELGISYEGLTNHILDQQRTQTPEVKADAALNEIREWKAARAEETRLAQVEQGKANVRAHVNAAADKYEHIAALGAHDEVFAEMSRLYNQTGEVPDIDQVAASIETRLETNVAKKILGLKRYAPQAASNAAAPGASAKVGSPTLSNATASQGSPGVGSALPTDPDERDRALNADPRFRIWG